MKYNVEKCEFIDFGRKKLKKVVGLNVVHSHVCVLYWEFNIYVIKVSGINVRAKEQGVNMAIWHILHHGHRMKLRKVIFLTGENLLNAAVQRFRLHLYLKKIYED